MLKKKHKERKKKTWLQSVQALSRPWSVACQERRMLRSMRLLVTLLQNPVPCSEGGSPSRPVPSQIHMICFPVRAGSLLSTPLMSGDVRLLGGNHTDDDDEDAAPRECNSETLLIITPSCRHHHNKATITNSFTLWGFSGYQPWRDSLWKIKGKQKLLIQSSGVVSFMLVLLFFFCRSQPQNRDMYVQYI